MNNKVPDALGYTHQIIEVEDVVLKAVALTRRVALTCARFRIAGNGSESSHVALQALLRMLK